MVNRPLFYDTCLVIPNVCHFEIESLRTSHQEVTKTLQKTQTSVFWPGLRRSLEERCLVCVPH